MRRDTRVDIPYRVRTYVPSPNSQAYVLMRRADFERIRKAARRVAKPRPPFSVWYPLCYGISASAAVALLTLRVTSTAASLVAYIVMWVMVVAGGLVGRAYQKTDGVASNHNRAEAREILDELDAIEESLLPDCYDLEPAPDIEFPSDPPPSAPACSRQPDKDGNLGVSRHLR